MLRTTTIQSKCYIHFSDNNTHRRLQTEEQVGAQAEVQAEVQTTVEQSTIAPVPNNDETQYFSSGTVPDSGQEAIDVLPAMQDVSIVLVPEPEPSIILISDEEVSQAAIPPQSQQILSIEHVRMSELIAHTAPKIEDVIARNPIETQANAIGKTLIVFFHTIFPEAEIQLLNSFIN